MALARIISRSPQCSRELALDLFARGYTVEIVSPDKIPANAADLELRVDTVPGDRVTATVESHRGEHSASFEFVRYLKAPKADPMRLPLGSLEAAPRVMGPVVRPELGPLDVVRHSEAAIGVNAGPRSAEPPIESAALPAAAPLAPAIVSPAAAVPTMPHDPLPTLPVEPPTYFAVEDASVVEPAASPLNKPMPSRRLRYRSAGWPLRAALAFAGVLLMAVVLVVGLRRTGRSAAESSAVAPVAEGVAASAELFPGVADSEKDMGRVPRQGPSQHPRKAPREVSALPSSPSPEKSQGKSADVPKDPSVVMAAAPTASRHALASRTRADSLIARDTVTYLDPRFDPRRFNKSAPKVKPEKSLARRRSRVRKRDAVIAANEVTYLHSKPTPKPAK